MNDGDSNERRWPAGNQLTDTPSVDKRRDEERGDRSRRARKGRWAGGGGKRKNVKTCTELVIWVWLNAINKLKSYLHSGSADMCVRSHVIALALSLGVPGKLY